ncbi:MAG: arginase family protein, partial [Pseudobdellovibrionaceae bacterium]
DIDVFTSAEAPGCSQSWPTGLSVAEFWPAYQWLLKNYDTPLLSIYEVSPALDVDSRTSKLAACIAYEYLFTDVLTGRKK